VSWTYRNEIPKSFQHRLDEYEYSGIDGTEYRDLGISGDLLPMVAVFDSIDHDRDAAALVAVLRETASPGNFGILEHPREGVVEVVVGPVNVTHNPTTDAGETIVEIPFKQQLTLPSQRKESPLITTVKQLQRLNAAAADDFGTQTVLNNIGDTLAAIEENESSIKKINDKIAPIVATNADILVTFNQIQTDVLNNLDTLVKTPLVLASQMQQMVQLAIDAPGLIVDKAKAWADLYRDAVGKDAFPDLYYDPVRNSTRVRIASQELVGVSAVGSSLANVVLQAADFTTKQQAFDALLDARAQILNLANGLDLLQDKFNGELFQEQYFANTQTYKVLSELFRIATLAIQEETLGLKTTVTVTLATDQTILDICAKYYKAVDDETLEFFIESNNVLVDQLYFPAGSVVKI
jgi:prophage DNA circulation protein